jgi:hypothetical protein
MPDFKYLDELYARTDQWESYRIDDEFKKEMGKVSQSRTDSMAGLYEELERLIAIAEKKRKENLTPQSTGAKGTANLAAFHAGQSDAAKAARQAKIDNAVREWRSYIASQKMWMGTGGVTDPPNQTITVAYDNQLAQEATQVEIDNGKLYLTAKTATGKSREPVDTAKMASFHSGIGYAIYVMSQERNLHIHSHVVGGYHHSSLLHGAPVFGAGEMKVSQGVVQLLTNKSGHYMPKRESLYCVLSMLQNRKVPLEFAVKEYGLGGPGDEFGSVTAFMKAYSMDDEGRERVKEAKAMVFEFIEEESGPRYVASDGAYKPFSMDD